MGWLEGGYQTLIDALERRIRELGGEVNAGTVVEQIAGANGQAIGLVVDGAFRPFDFVLCTLAPPQARSLLAPSLLDQAPDDHCRYLGVICLLLRVKRSVSPYYHLNITDRRVPLTTIVETTHVVDPEHAGGSLLYVSKYVDPSHPDHNRDADEPVHLLGGAKRLPEMFSVPNLALASTAHVYPEIVSGQAVTGVTERVVPGILERVQAEERVAA